MLSARSIQTAALFFAILLWSPLACAYNSQIFLTGRGGAQCLRSRASSDSESLLMIIVQRFVPGQMFAGRQCFRKIWGTERMGLAADTRAARVMAMVGQGSAVRRFAYVCLETIALLLRQNDAALVTSAAIEKRRLGVVDRRIFDARCMGSMSWCAASQIAVIDLNEDNKPKIWRIKKLINIVEQSQLRNQIMSQCGTNLRIKLTVSINTHLLLRFVCCAGRDLPPYNCHFLAYSHSHYEILNHVHRSCICAHVHAYTYGRNTVHKDMHM
jgi:hypothetical protein